MGSYCYSFRTENLVNYERISTYSKRVWSSELQLTEGPRRNGNEKRFQFFTSLSYLRVGNQVTKIHIYLCSMDQSCHQYWKKFILFFLKLYFSLVQSFVNLVTSILNRISENIISIIEFNIRNWLLDLILILFLYPYNWKWYYKINLNGLKKDVSSSKFVFVYLFVKSFQL